MGPERQRRVEENNDSVRVKVYIAFGRIRVRARLGMCICARTTARIRRHADKEHKEQHRKLRRRTNLCVLVYCSVSVYTRVSVSICVHKRMVHVLPTRVRSHFTVLSRSPETSQSRPCDGNGDGDGLFFYFDVRSFEISTSLI